MIKTILAQVREYRLPTVLAPLFTVGEVVLEVLIPFVTASIIDKGIQAGNIQQVYLYGGLMLLMALLSLRGPGGTLRGQSVLRSGVQPA